MQGTERREATVTLVDDGMRLDLWLVKTWPWWSRSRWQNAIRRQAVRVNGALQPARYGVKAGDHIVASVETTAGAAPAPAPATTLPPWVVYCDEHVLVVNKPRGMVVHPAHGHHGDTLADWVAPWVTPEPASERPGIVHRLDRDTTGLLVVARTPRARQALAEAIAARTVRREYVALARGHLAPERGVIDAPIGRDPTNRQRMAVVWGGRDARTDYRTLATFRQASLLHCRLQTGRTHQIRVHLASSGHPVLGDEVYGGHWPAASHGQLLHAIRLAFRHPVTGHMLDFVQWPPPDWREAARWLGPATITADTVFSDRSESTRQLLAELGWVGSPADPPGSG